MSLGSCPVCQREVHPADGDLALCPVCSSPLVETADGSDESGASNALLAMPPEIYLG